MRVVLIVLAFVLSTSCVLGHQPMKQMDAQASVNEIAFALATSCHKLGPRHPETIEMKRSFQIRIETGERLNLQKADEQLAGYFRDYQLNRKKLGPRHPETRQNLRDVAIATKMLISEPDYFSENWEQFLLE